VKFAISWVLTLQATIDVNLSKLYCKKTQGGKGKLENLKKKGKKGQKGKR
jgi:hypothetical protein